MKAYTNLEQSKKLAEILPLESADMWYSYYGNSKYNPTIAYEGQQWFLCQIRNSRHDDIPCWSLSVLLDVLSKWAECVNEAGITELSYEKVTKWGVSMLNCGKIEDCYADNPVDTCVAMIEKLHELNLL